VVVGWLLECPAIAMAEFLRYPRGTAEEFAAAEEEETLLPGSLASALS
jgi:hypothetical protein